MTAIKMETDLKSPDNLLHKTSRKPFNWRKRLPGFAETLVVLSAFLLGYSYKSFLGGNTPLFPVLLVMGVYLMLSVFSTIVSETFGWRAKGLLLETFALLLPFVFGTDLKYVFSAALFVFLFGAWGASDARKEFNNSVHIRFARDSRLQFGKMVTGLTLAAVLLYMPQWQDRQELVSESAFSGIVGSVTSAFTRIYPEFEFNKDMSLEAIAQSIALSKLRNNPIFKDMSEDRKREVLGEAATQFIDSIKQNFGSEVRAEDTLTRVFYSVFVGQAKNLQQKLGDSFVWLWALIMFFLIRGLGAIVSVISAYTALAIYHLLLATNILRVDTESVSAERIRFQG